MSLKIDTSDPSKLTDAELKYLADRGQLPEGIVLDTEDAGDADEPPTEGAYDSMKVGELRDLCEQRGLPKGGSQTDLIERLTESDNASDDGDEIIEED